VQYYSVGECEVVAIQDTTQTVAAALFGEDDAVQQTLRKLYPRDAAPSSVNLFLIHSGNRFILVDTGLGNQRSSLVQALDELRVLPAQITDILLTHLHPDHVGGMISPKGQPVFPNATVWLSAEEFRGMKLGSRDVAPLLRSIYLAYHRKLKLVKDGQEVLPGIVAKTQKRPFSIQIEASYWFFFRRWNSQPPFSGSFVLKRYVSSILTLTLMT